MQVNHINKDTIRVRIDKDELARRGLKVLDLLGDKNKIQHFFYSILDEIDTDHSFTQDVPVTFQVMPNKGGLDLLITKVTSSSNQQETFAQLLAADAAADHQEEIKEPKPLRSFFDLAPTEEVAEGQLPAWQTETKQLYCFEDLMPVLELADTLHDGELSSSLYFANGKYFMVLAFTNADYQQMKPADVWVIADEYGLKAEPTMIEHIERLADCIFADDALEQIRYYFAKRKH